MEVYQGVGEMKLLGVISLVIVLILVVTFIKLIKKGKDYGHISYSQSNKIVDIQRYKKMRENDHNLL